MTRASGSRPAATRSAASTSVARARRAASPSTSTPRTRPATGTTPSSGWPRSRGATAPSRMWGISYGGFTAIQVAALRPPHLRAIVPVMATDDRYLDDVHYRGGCVTVSELSQYAVSQVAMNAMPPDAALPRAPPGATSGWPGWRPRRRGCSRGSATRPTGRTGDRGRWRPTTTRSRRRSSTSAAGTTATSTRRSGCRRAARRHRTRSSGNWYHSWPHDASPGPNLDELHEIDPVPRSPPARHRQRLGRGAARRVVRARVRPAGAVSRERARAAGGRRSPIPIQRRSTHAWHFGDGDVPLVGRLVQPGSGDGSLDVEAVPPASTRSGTARRPARAAHCPGAPAAHRTAWLATSAATRTPARPTPTGPWRRRSRSSASPRSSCTVESTRRSPPCRCGSATSRPTARSHW